MAETRAQLNRKVRQEALRQQLETQGHLQHIVDLLDKIQDPEERIESDMINRYKMTIDTKLKLLNKYLPDLKAQEITGEGGEQLRPFVIGATPDIKDDEWLNTHKPG